MVDTVKELAKQFEKANKGRFDLVTVEVKAALFFAFCFTPAILQTWTGDDLVKLNECVRNYYT
jgi:hypothetical protein